MKKVLFFAVACLSLMACGNKAQSEQNADSLSAQTADSLVFEGQFPNADGGQMNVKLALAQDSTKGFVLAEDTTMSKGTYEEVTAGDKKGYKLTKMYVTSHLAATASSLHHLILLSLPLLLV